jgi:hypothetical protein
MFKWLKKIRWQKDVEGARIEPTSRDTFMYTDETGRRVEIWAEPQPWGRLIYAESISKCVEPDDSVMSDVDRSTVRRRVERFFTENNVAYKFK